MADKQPNRKRPEQVLMIGGPDDIGASDYYPTPDWVTRWLIDLCPPPAGLPVIEPAAGSGAVVRVLLEHDYKVVACELRPREMPGLRTLLGDDRAFWGDWLKRAEEIAITVTGNFSVVTNPPYALGLEFCETSLALEPAFVAMLLRLNILGSRKWSRLFRDRPPSAMLPLTRRPSFTGDGKTSMDTYAWIVWRENGPSIDLRYH